MNRVEKVAIIGLDCADPGLTFDRWLDDLPNLRRLCESGLWGRLESCLPPVTVPAWSCMAASKDPGTLGVYGFRNRRDWSYENLGLATNLDVRHPRMWDYFGRAGLHSITVSVPQTFPIVHPPRGCQVTCFLTPSTASPYTHPPELASEIADLCGEFILDVSDLASEDKGGLLDRIYRMARQRFELGRHLATTRPWNLLWLVEMGVDRLQHAFWRFMDPGSPGHVPGNPYQAAIHDYYVFIDRQIGQLLDVFDLERTAVWVVSDHGAKRLDGGFCLNDWLIAEGFLVMKDPPTGKRKFRLAEVDWSRTQVWGEGGYTGQLFINQAGREPQGIVPPDRVNALCQELSGKLESLTDPAGRPIGSRAYRPQQIYNQANGFPPDLVVLLGDLHWRSVGSIGHRQPYVLGDELGPENANHAMEGLYILSHASLRPGRQDASLYDVLPTTLALMGMTQPRGLRGRSLVGA